MQVRVLCRIQLYRDRGFINLDILDFDPHFAKGLLAMAKEALLRELRAKSLDRKNKATFFSDFPLRVGLISANQSRAKSDFLDQLQLYHFAGEVVFKDCQMQGEAVIQQVPEAIRSLQTQGCDVIVVTRGGGSAADLRWFDHKDVAMAIIECPTPVVAAIGHHDDVCVAEEVCFLRQKTPTAAADFILHRCQQTRLQLDKLAQQTREAVQRHLILCKQQQHRMIESFAHRINRAVGHQQHQLNQTINGWQQTYHRAMMRCLQRFHGIQSRLKSVADDRLSQGRLRWQNQMLAMFQRLSAAWSGHQKQIDSLQSRLRHQTDKRLDHDHGQLQLLHSRIQGRDPSSWLARGWTRLELEGQPLASVRLLKKNSKIKARLADGVVDLAVEAIYPLKKGKPS